jgi:hypothetical protein
VNDSVRNSVIAGLMVAAIGGISHIIWQELGWPCVYPLVRHWIKGHIG